MLEVKIAKLLYGDAYKNLAELKGSAKQVDWASDIRESKIAEIFVNEACIKNPFMGKVLLNVFKRQDSASFWIDNRDRDVVKIATGVKMLGIAGLRDEVLAEKSNLESAVGNIDEYNKNFVETEMRRLYNVRKACFAKGDELAKKSARTPEEKEQKRIVNLVWLTAKYLLDDYKKIYPDVDFEIAEPLKSDNAVDDKQITDLAEVNFWNCNSTTADDDDDDNADDTTVKIKVDTVAKTDSDIIVKVSAGFDYVGYLDYDPDGIDDSITLLDVEVNEGPNAFISKLYKVPVNDIFREGVAVVFTYSLNSCDETISFPCDFSESPAIKNFDDVKKYNWIFDYDLIHAINDGNDYSKFLAEDYGYDDDEDESTDKV